MKRQTFVLTSTILLKETLENQMKTEDLQDQYLPSIYLHDKKQYQAFENIKSSELGRKDDDKSKDKTYTGRKATRLKTDVKIKI